MSIFYQVPAPSSQAHTKLTLASAEELQGNNEHENLRSLYFHHIDNCLLEFERRSWLQFDQLRAVYALESGPVQLPAGKEVVVKVEGKLFLLTVSQLDEQMSLSEKLSWSQVIFPDRYPPPPVVIVSGRHNPLKPDEGEAGMDNNNYVVMRESILIISQYSLLAAPVSCTDKMFSVQENVKLTQMGPPSIDNTPLSSPRQLSLESMQLLDLKGKSSSLAASSAVALSPHVSGVNMMSSITSSSVAAAGAATINNNSSGIHQQPQGALDLNISTASTMNDEYRLPLVDYSQLSAQSVTEDDFMFFDDPAADVESETALETPQDLVATESNAAGDGVKELKQDVMKENEEESTSGEFKLSKYDSGGTLHYEPTPQPKKSKCSRCGGRLSSFTLFIHPAANDNSNLCQCQIQEPMPSWKDAASMQSVNDDLLLLENESKTSGEDSKTRNSRNSSQMDLMEAKESLTSFDPYSYFNGQNQQSQKNDLRDYLDRIRDFSQMIGISPVCALPPFPIQIGGDDVDDRGNINFEADMIDAHLQQILIDYHQHEAARNPMVKRIMFECDRALCKLKLKQLSIADLNTLLSNNSSNKYSKFNVKKKKGGNELSLVCASVDHLAARATDHKVKAGEGLITDSLDSFIKSVFISKAYPYGGRRDVKALFLHSAADPIVDIQFKYVLRMTYQGYNFGNFDWLNDVNIACFNEANYTRELFEKTLNTITATVSSYLIMDYTLNNDYLMVLIENVLDESLHYYALQLVQKWKRRLIDDLLIKPRPAKLDPEQLESRIVVRLMPPNCAYQRKMDDIVRVTRLIYNSLNIIQPALVPASLCAIDTSCPMLRQPTVLIIMWTLSFCRKYIFGSIFDLRLGKMKSVSFETESVTKDAIVLLVKKSFPGTQIDLLAFFTNTTCKCSSMSNVIDQIIRESDYSAFVEISCSLSLVKNALPHYGWGFNDRISSASADALELHIEGKSYESHFVSLTSDHIVSYQMRRKSEKIDFQSWKNLCKDFNDLRLIETGDSMGLPFPWYILRNSQWTFMNVCS